MTTINRKFYQIAISLVLLISFVIRYKGVWFGYPLPVHPDEPKIVNTALRILQTGDFNPHFFNYPTLTIYLLMMIYNAFIFWKKLLWDLQTIPMIDFYIVGRMFVVILSTATIYITYKIGDILLHPIVGSAAACFIGGNFLHITNSYTITVDSPVAFWSALSVLMAVLIYEKGSKHQYYLLSGIFAGCAISSKYTAFLCAVPLIVAHVCVARKQKIWLNKSIILGVLAIPVFFILTSPYVVVDYKAFWKAIRYEATHYRTGHAGAESLSNTSFILYGRYLLTQGYGIIPMILAIGGLLWLGLHDTWKALLLGIFPILLFLFVGQYKVYFPRNIVALIPFFALFSGICLYATYLKGTELLAVWRKPVPKRVALFLVLICVLSGIMYSQVAQSLRHIHKITLPDTRWVSLQWIISHLPPGSKIGREHYTPPVEHYSAQFHVVYLGYHALLNNFDKLQFIDYIILSEGDYGRFMNSSEVYSDEASIYKTFFANNTLIKAFVPDGYTIEGPTIKIYAVTH